MTVGDYVKQYRMANSMSQRQFAARSGLSSGYISMLEANRSPRTGEPIEVSLTTLKQLCDAMGVTVSEVLKTIRGDQPVTSDEGHSVKELNLTAKEWKLLGWFRAVEEPYQDAVLDMLQARVKSRR